MRHIRFSQSKLWLAPLFGILLSVALIFALLPQNVLAQTGMSGSTTTTSTSPAPPTVKTVTPTTNVTANSADLRGNLVDMGAAASVQVYFIYGLNTSYGNTSAAQAMTATGFFSINVVGLNPNTTYHYQVVAVNDTGKAQGSDASFTTPPIQSVTTSTTTNPPPNVPPTTSTATPPPVTTTAIAIATWRTSPTTKSSASSASTKFTELTYF
jgi:hypothetical protein